MPEGPITKVLAHPTRVAVLRLLKGHTLTPSLLSKKLGLPLSNVTYHVGYLEEHECLKMVRTKRVRGATAHFYEITPTGVEALHEAEGKFDDGR